jgi:hypothetical protein
MLARDLNVVVLFILVAAAVAVGWTLGNMVTAKVGLHA